YTFKKMIGDSMVICLCTTLVFLGLLILNNDALLFFEQYWNQRLKAVIVGGREDMRLLGWDKLYSVSKKTTQFKKNWVQF
ncbi:MAG: hypothetical protein WAU01_07755, partial [Saprospiraceae bacterium]